MKSLISLIVVIFFFSTMSGQILKKETLLAMKRDNVTGVTSSTFPGQLNSCFDQKGNKFSLLGLSIKSKAKQCFVYLLEQEKLDVNKSCDGISPLMYAAKYDQLEMTQKLIEAGADPTLKNNGKTALDFAKRYRRAEIVEYLENL